MCIDFQMKEMKTDPLHRHMDINIISPYYQTDYILCTVQTEAWKTNDCYMSIPLIMKEVQ